MKHFFSLTDTEFKMEKMNENITGIKVTDRDADYCEKELETISRGQGKNIEFIRRDES